MKTPNDWVAFDVETTGLDEPQQALQPWSDRARMISYAHASWATLTKPNASATAEVSQVSAFLQKIIVMDVPVIGWNTPFDVAWLIKMGFGEQVKKIKWLDGMLLWRALERYPESEKTMHNRKRYGLKEAVAEFLPNRAGYDDDIEFTVNQRADAKLLAYNKRDAGFTLAIGRILWNQLVKSNPKGLRVCLLECACIPMVAEHYVNGLEVDIDEAKSLDTKLAKRIAELAKVVEGYGVTEKVLRSPAQLSRLFYDEWQLPVLAKTPKGAPSTDKNALHELSFIDERIAAIKEFRELANLKTKFVHNIIQSTVYNRSNTTHPTMRMSSTYTGRATFSSFIGRGTQKRQTGFAIHQMKRAADYRRLIKAPDGYQIVEWDAAGQEYRWMAIMSGDKVMLRLCQVGEDPHSFMGAQMSQYEYKELVAAVHDGVQDAKRVRQSGKVGNLSCQYRIGTKKLLTTARVQHGMDWTMADATRVYKAYHSSYRGVRDYWDRQIQKCRRLGYAETIAGRRVILNGSWNGNNSWQLESTAVNFPIQGVGADQKYLAMASIKKLLDKYDGHFLFELHDGLYSIFPDEVAHEAAHAGKVVLDNLPYERVWGFEPPIPLPWDIKIGPNWGDMIEL